MHSSHLAEGRAVDIESSVTTSERKKHSNTADVYLVQGRVELAAGN